MISVSNASPEVLKDENKSMYNTESVTSVRTIIL